ncbi:MAG: hydrolase [Thermofilaceae archaeon]|nr:hydrolase [Thermofilaceae archaeon]MCX8180000.1 hydrolase [Thermofilaceae archaeon]MDW8004694.1 hydrolase [Thermofilaceae archaeon]
MPLTPFHLGPALALGLPLRRKLHVPTLILSSIACDVEPLLVLAFNLDYPLHGYLHTLIAATLLGVAIGTIMKSLEPSLKPLYDPIRLEDRKPSLSHFLAAGVLGTTSHVLLDAPLYSDIKPLYPLQANPFYNPSATLGVYSFCLLSGLLGLAYYIRLLTTRK